MLCFSRFIFTLAIGCLAFIEYVGATDMSLEGETHTFLLEAASDANNFAPVAVDIVLTTNPDVQKKLAEFSARTYFQQRQQLMLDHPQQILVLGWEIVPSQSLRERVVLPKEPMAGAYVFADYATPGQHRASLLPDTKDLRVTLGRTSFTVAPIA